MDFANAVQGAYMQKYEQPYEANEHYIYMVIE